LAGEKKKWEKQMALYGIEPEEGWRGKTGRRGGKKGGDQCAGNAARELKRNMLGDKKRSSKCKRQLTEQLEEKGAGR